MATQPDPSPLNLNLNAPLLSTRRPTGSPTSPNTGWDQTRVPFAWELSAGTPKVSRIQFHDEFHNISPIPPPPGRKVVEHEHDQYDGDDDFSDAMDTFSLSAAIDMVESAEMAKLRGNMLDGMELDPGGNQSPSFIIQRFLSDAKALAVSSGLPIPKNVGDQKEKCKVEMINGSPKGCGLGLDGLFRRKHKPPCGVKSPVRVASASVKSQWGWKPKEWFSMYKDLDFGDVLL
ncbi:uncharacterized protein LOC143542152 [Bidens hawaiensis]|uniref:uncharacterized protein LOC143542152 n=1 Tax=Bidens hawaiensis TaxID=980011 RepID=UPI00404A727C